MKEEEIKTWWDAFAQAGGLDQLETWLGGVDAPSRLRIRQRIAECEYQTVADCGAGLGIDWIGMQNISYPVDYVGVEPSKALRDASDKVAHQYGKGKMPLVEGTIEKLPFQDSSRDLVYARHILEHLPKIQPALNEMIRAARFEVVVVFFMRPGKETYLTRERDGLWQNWWSKSEIERILELNDKVEVWFWETLHSEVLLHVYVKGATVVDLTRVGNRLLDAVTEEPVAEEVAAVEEAPTMTDWPSIKNVAPHEAEALRRAGRL